MVRICYIERQYPKKGAGYEPTGIACLGAMESLGKFRAALESCVESTRGFHGSSFLGLPYT